MDQTKQLYAWEDAWSSWNAASCTLSECRRFVRMACKSYKVPVPSVTMHKHTEYSYFSPDDNKIALRHDQRNVPIALHEASHAILWHYYRDTIADHGKEFVGVYLYLLTMSECAPAIALTASLRHYGIRWTRNMTPEKVLQKKKPAQEAG